MKNIYRLLKAQQFTFFYLIILLALSSHANASEQWHLERNENDIKVYLKNTSTSAVKSFKAITKVKSNLSSLVAVMDDSSSFTRWLYNCRTVKTLKRNDTEIINYLVTNMPWPVVDRDAVIQSNRSQNTSSKVVEYKLKALTNYADKVVNKVRITDLHGRWLFKPLPDGLIEVNYEMTIDPGGNIPKWLVNALAVDIPFHTLTNLKYIIREPKYRDAKVKGIIN